MREFKCHSYLQHRIDDLDQAYAGVYKPQSFNMGSVCGELWRQVASKSSDATWSVLLMQNY